jgi:hypothetical protein
MSQIIKTSVCGGLNQSLIASRITSEGHLQAVQNAETQQWDVLFYNKHINHKKDDAPYQHVARNLGENAMLDRLMDFDRNATRTRIGLMC